MKDDIPTSERLARDLKDLNDPKLNDMIKKAQKGYYDDYKTTIPFPTIALVKDLLNAGYPDLAKQAKQGKWESSDQEAREWFHKEGWPLLANSLK